MNVYIPIIKNCNKNCNYCCSCSPLYDEGEYVCSANEIIDGIDKIEKVIGENLDKIVFGGGEPLLNKNILNILENVYNRSNKYKIFIRSNGILVDKMSEEFYLSISKYNVVIEISFYSVININKFNKINNMLNKYNVKFEFITNSKNCDTVSLINKKCYNVFYKICINKSWKKKDIINNIYKCGVFNKKCYNVLDVKDKKLYLCDLISSVKKIDSYFKYKFYQKMLNKIDFIDLNDKNITKQDIKSFGIDKFNFCKYCYYDLKNEINPDIVSKKIESEWIKE